MNFGTVKTVTNIEVSGLCNNSCEYCPSPKMKDTRKGEVGLMSMETFSKCMGFVAETVKQGTQRELNLFGIGEPLLNPNIVEMTAMARRIIPRNMPVHINTNGKLLTMEIARALKVAGISHIDITDHDAYQTVKSIRTLTELDVPFQVSRDFVKVPNNWAGQVGWFQPEYTMPCPWVLAGQVMIWNDGQIVQCCLDAFGSGILGSVYTHAPAQVNIKPHGLCATCHHKIFSATQNTMHRLQGG